jgi:hypothetical protein
MTFYYFFDYNDRILLCNNNKLYKILKLQPTTPYNYC